ncbi:MAG: hypothetical protein GY714_27490 [Desulfobacterales bacterium]|nr:hypothetical protein [Desulfobacterales bacterium]MCP4163455.1 hypothetical protein [Deltaproteobacteria bacterium]
MKKVIVSIVVIMALLVPQMVIAKKTNPAIYELNEIAVKLFEISREITKSNRYIGEKNATDMEEARSIASLQGHLKNASAMCYMQHLMIFNVNSMNENTKTGLNYSEAVLRDSIVRIRESRDGIASETVVLILDQSIDKLEAALQLMSKCSKILS